MPTAFSKPASPIRVAYIDHTALMSGGEIALYNLVTHLDRAVVHPVVILFSEGPLAEKLRAAGVETLVLPMTAAVLQTRKDSLGASSLLKIRAVFASVGQAWRVRRAIRRLDAKIVHTNSLKADLIGGLAGRLAGRWVIWHIRDRIEADYLPAIVVRVFRWLSRVIPHHVIANSRATLQTLQIGDSTPADSSVVYSGVVIHDGTLLPARLHDAESGTSSFPMIGLMGRISPWKGQDVLIRAAALLRDRGIRARYRIIGSAMFGEEAYELELKQMVDAAGLNDVIEFRGFQSDAAGEISSLDVLVHTSKLPEPFGQVVVEGMAAGKPVIASRAGGVVEIIEDGFSGLLIEPGNAEELAAALQRVLADPELASRLGRLGRRRVENRFTIDRVARDVEYLYLALTGHQPMQSTASTGTAGTPVTPRNSA
jgi:glycosyltransferase involved in cell wall biosynthesis